MSVDLIRGLVDATVLTPDDAGETLQIDLRGNLAAMLGAAVQTKRSPESDDLSLQVLWLRRSRANGGQCQRSVSTGSMRNARMVGTAAASSPMAKSNAVVAAYTQGSTG
jgi:hypothetical protein